MKTDRTGGGAAGDNLETRLAHRFAVDLDRAEQDHPAFGPGGRAALARPSQPRRRWPGLAVLVVAILVVAFVALPRNQQVPESHAIPGASTDVGSDGVPAQIDGQRVYRAGDQASFPTSGSFLLGGPVTMPEVIPPCPMPIDHSTAEDDLIPYCYWEAIDGIHVAPRVDALADFGGRVVVARVHIDDPEATGCPAAVLAQCSAAVVVEEVVWTGRHDAQRAGATPFATGPLNPVSSAGVGTAEPNPIGPDGVPLTVDGQAVYRAGTMPGASSFLLGGKLSRDTSCATPATPTANPPACGYWMIDGVKVGTTVDMSVAALGQIVVAQVEGGAATIVVVEIVWPNLELPPSPPPLPTALPS